MYTLSKSSFKELVDTHLRTDVARYKKLGFGVEVEAEGTRLLPHEIDSAVWQVKSDGSLRNYHGRSAEYVTNGPVTEEGVGYALRELKEAIGTSLRESPRTSVHIHVNVQQLTPVQLLSFIAAYAICEDNLLSYCGGARRNNLFCAPLYTQARIQNCIINLMNGGFNTPSIEDTKYCAINIGAIRRFGSLEFRSLDGCVVNNELDSGRINLWVYTLNKLLTNSLTETPDKLLYRYYVDGHEATMRRLLGKLSEQPNTPHIKKCLNFLEDLAHSVTSWELKGATNDTLSTQSEPISQGSFTGAYDTINSGIFTDSAVPPIFRTNDSPSFTYINQPGWFETATSV